MAKKKLTKTLWYGSEKDVDGNPIVPNIAPSVEKHLEGINEGEIYIHNDDANPSIFIRTNADKVVGIGGAEALSKHFLRKDKPDTAKEKITFEKGVEVGSDKEGKGITYDKETKKATAIIDELKKLLLLQSDEFMQGELGSGFILKYDKEKKRSYFEIDEILVRKIAYFVSLVIKDLKHVGGSLILSPASMTCSKVEVYDTYYRCYFEQNDGEKTINNEFVAGDFARSQTFNIKEGTSENVSNTYYWRYVVNVGDNFIDLSITDCDSGSGIPKKGDEIVQLGNRYDESRQNAIILSTVGDDAPSIKQYKGIKYYFLSNDNAVTFFSPSGNVIKGNFISASTGKNLDEEIKDIKIDWDKILEQTDKEFTLWFFPYEPTLDNLPASDWTSEELKQLHDQDMFFDDSTGQATSGKAWRFEKKNDVWGWYEITDAETIKALENIKQKKRVFVAQPTIDDAYDVGDLWICEEYGEMYKKEVLVCIQSKNKGESFSISHWAATVDETTSYIERLDKRITLAVTESKEGLEEAKNLAQNGIDSAYEAYQKALEALGLAGTANGKAEENTAAIQVNKNSITALANGIHFDENGNITNINTSGLVVTSDFATLFSQAYNASDETVKRSEISTFVTSDEVGNMISGAYIGADQIYLNGYTIINDHFTVDASGNVTMHDFSAENGVFSGTVYADDGYFTGEINATSGTITGNLTVGSGSVPLIIQPTNSDSYPALVWQSDPKVFLQMGVYNVNGAVSGQAYFSDDDGNHTTIFPFSTVIHSAGYTSVLRGGQITIEDSEFKVTVDKCLHIYSPAWCLESKAIDGEVYVDGSGYVKVKNPIRV